MGISQYRLAKDIGVHPRRINGIVHGKRAITANTALRLSRYFGLSERFWLNLQSRYDLEMEKDRMAGQLEREVKVYAGAARHSLAPRERARVRARGRRRGIPSPLGRGPG